MDDKILVKTILDTEIDVLEGFLDKDREKVLTADALYVSISDLDQLKGHLDTLKKMREKGWRNWKMMKNDVDIDATTAPAMELEYRGRKVENYPGEFENLVKERDNWREMYDEELKMNEELTRINSVRGDEIDRLRQKRTGLELENDELKTKLSCNEEMLSNRYSDIARLKKENDELSRINSVRLGDVNRLQDKVDILEYRNESLNDCLSNIAHTYKDVLSDPLTSSALTFKREVGEILEQYKPFIIED